MRDVRGVFQQPIRSLTLTTHPVAAGIKGDATHEREEHNYRVRVNGLLRDDRSDGANLATPSSAVAQTTILWSADMESGYLLESNGGEWDEEVVTDSADSSAQLASSMGIPPYSGSYVMKQSVLGSVGGTRMGSYNEITTR